MLRSALLGMLTLFSVSIAVAEDAIEKLEYVGSLIQACTLPGDTRGDDVVPRHANSLQLSRDRWLVIYSTHGYRGVDDERSIVYQVRSDAPDGRVLKEGYLSRGEEDWFPARFDRTMLEPGQTLYKQHGHMVAFGVPHGALIDGQPAPHAGLFVAKWRVVGRVLDKRTNYLRHSTSGPDRDQRGQGVEWVQFRLSATRDDIEIVEPVRRLRQSGFETGAAFCSAPVAWMNQSFTPAIPFNAAANEWADCNHFDGGRLAVLKYRYNAKRARYEWIETGPLVGSEQAPLMEASLVHTGGEWLIAARRHRQGGTAWMRSSDPFNEITPPVYPGDPLCNAPLTVFRSADGVVRLFTGDPKNSPNRNARDPLYCWNVSTTGEIRCEARRTIFDSVAAGLPIRREVVPKLDFCELFPHLGRTQLISFGLSTRAYNHPYENRTDIPALNADEKRFAGVYYARITYRRAPPPRWHFAP